MGEWVNGYELRHRERQRKAEGPIYDDRLAYCGYDLSARRADLAEAAGPMLDLAKGPRVDWFELGRYAPLSGAGID